MTVKLLEKLFGRLHSNCTQASFVVGVRTECFVLYVDRLVTLSNVIKVDLFQLQSEVMQIGLKHTHTHSVSLHFTYTL